MKPKKRIYCYGCKKPKMLFESQSSADNFIRFNSEEIKVETGIQPLRSYYCQFCLGWHVTSLTSKEIGLCLDKRDNHVIDKIGERKSDSQNMVSQHKSLEALKEKAILDLENMIAIRLDKVNADMYFGDVEACKKELCLCSKVLDEMHYYNFIHSDTSRLVKKYESITAEFTLLLCFLQCQDLKQKECHIKVENEALYEKIIKRMKSVDLFNDKKNLLLSLLSQYKFDEFDILLESIGQEILSNKNDMENFLVCRMQQELKYLKRKRLHVFLRLQRKLKKGKKNNGILQNN